MEERWVETELFVDVGAQELTHLTELGEHQRTFARIEQLGDQLVETREFARTPGET